MRLIEYVKNILLFLFLILVAFIVSTDIDFEDQSFWSLLTSFRFWVKTVVLAFVCTILYDWIADSVLVANKQYTGGKVCPRLYKTLRINETRIERIQNEHLMDKVEQGVVEYNAKKRLFANQKYMDKFNASVKISDIDMIALASNFDEEIKNLYRRYGIVRERTKKKFRKRIMKIVEGRIKPNVVATSEMIMTAGFADNAKADSVEDKTMTLKTWHNIYQAARILLMFTGTSIILFDLVINWDFATLYQYIFYIIFSAVSGIFYGATIVEYKTRVYYNRNSFFAEYVGVCDVPDNITLTEREKARNNQQRETVPPVFERFEEIKEMA